MRPPKLICLFLIVFLLLSGFTGCGEQGDTAADVEETVYTELTDEYITCVVTALVSESFADVEVCGDVFGALSDKVTIVMDGLSKLNIAVGDELRVKINSVVKWNGGESLKVYVKNVQIIALGDGHKSDGMTAVYKEGDREYGPYPILALSEITLSTKFPTANEMMNKSYEIGYEGVLKNGLFRVVEIRDDIVYMAEICRTQATWALVGIPDVNFNVGDHVQLYVAKSYSTPDSPYVNVTYLEDLLEFGIADEQIVAEQYFWENIAIPEKPVIYLYPEKDTVCSVKLNLDGKFTCTYPAYGTDGWQNFTAKPDGTLIFPDGSEYYCLYWEGRMDFNYDFSKGFCVKGSDTAVFLEWALCEMGLTPREANEFIIYWLPQLQNNPYNLISFQGENYEAAADLEITPAPDSILRIYMVAKPLTAPVEVEPQTFEPFERNGFTVVEWGGSIIE